MAISLPPDIVEDLYGHSSKAGFVVSVESEQGHALREALRSVERRGYDEIPYPDAPADGPLATFSDFSVRTDGYGLVFDMPDAASYRTDSTPVTVDVDTMAPAASFGDDQPMERLVAILVEELRTNGITDCTVVRFPVAG
jgi:hypothetical protein